MAKKKNFTWKVGEPLPKIEAHTDRKLEVIEQYLDVYFDTVTANRRMETLRITIVDGFCGGGLYQKGSEIRIGSPFALLEAVERAKVKINAERHKPLNFVVHYYFSDANKFHMAMLRDQLLKSKFAALIDESVILQTGEFETLLPKIIADIKRRQNKGRSFFCAGSVGLQRCPDEVPATNIHQLG